jgi:hypothetical protein
MSGASERSAGDEESDELRLQETLGNMSISELFELLADIQARIRSKQGSEPDEFKEPVRRSAPSS